MLEMPDLPHERIIACLQGEYGIPVAQLTFLPLGADVNTAVYHVLTEDRRQLFLKLRSGDFDEVYVTLPRYLFDQGIAQIIPPLKTRAGQLWTELDSSNVILYPYIEGRNGYESLLSERQWAEFGRALKAIHTTPCPSILASRIPQETYSPRWRQLVRGFLVRAGHETWRDPVAAEVTAPLWDRRAEIHALIERAERLARRLLAQSPEPVICHSDIHAGNILISADGALYIVDWDTLTLAPKERDLMYVGGGLMGNGYTPAEEEALFYSGYGETQIDDIALAYYRYERIVQDIAAFCEQLLLSTAGGDDRQQSLKYLTSNFLPNGTIAIAYQTDRTLSSEM